MNKTKSILFGPAILVTAAFIGPGTVLVASKAGAIYGFSLLWAVAFSVASAIVLQEMSARLGIVTGDGLGQAIKKSFINPWLRFSVLTLILLAILIGNAAFQTGNLLGAATGATVLTESKPNPPAVVVGSGPLGSAGTKLARIESATTSPPHLTGWTILAGTIAWLLILTGKFELLQKVLTGLVLAMSVLFLFAAALSQPEFTAIIAGLVPQIPAGSEWFIVALIGTTIVPYNLFLHASAAAQRWPSDAVRKTSDKEKAVRDSRRDTIVSVCVGGFVTSAILITAAMAFHANEPSAAETKLDGLADVAKQLEPALGSWAKWLFGAGLCAAGLTSAITAPIAAAYAAAGCFGWPNQLSDWRLKMVASVVVFAGVGFAIAFGNTPQQAILMAQAANGLLLPIIAIFLVAMMNRVQLMFRFHNTLFQNLLAAVVILVVAVIAARQIGGVIQKLFPW